MREDWRRRLTDDGQGATETLRAYLGRAGEFELGRDERAASSPSYSPERRSSRPRCRLDVGPHAFGVHAFVARRPDENHERVYRWLLERNLKMYGVAFAVDHLGDIYLDGRLPLVGGERRRDRPAARAVLTYADESFNTILELGFATSIRKEWEWRISRGESTRNLEAFHGWLDRVATVLARLCGSGTCRQLDYRGGR